MDAPDRPRQERRPDRLLERAEWPALDRPPGRAGRAAGAGLESADRSRRGQAGRAHHRRRLRLRLDQHRARASRSRRRASCSASTSPGRCWPARASSRRRELPVDFVLADATVYPFDPGSFDLLVSRFGVMFFAEPALSFANLRRALRPSGRAGVRLLARAARKSLDDGAAAGGLPARAEAAAAGARGSRSVRLRVGRAREPHPRRRRLQGIAMEPIALSFDIAIGRGLDAAVQAALRDRARRAARWTAIRRRRCAPPRNPCGKLLAPFCAATACRSGSIWIVTARAS